MAFKSRTLVVIAASVAVWAALPGDRLSAREAIGSQPGDCELHIWPAKGLGSVYYGWFHGGTVNGQTAGRKGYPYVPPNPLTSAAQIDLIGAADSATLIGSAGYTLIVHPEPLETSVIRADAGRVIASDSPCYAEYIVDDATLRQDAFTGSSLMTLVRFRDYGAEKNPVRRFGTWVRMPLKLFPPKKDVDPAPALAELTAAYMSNLKLFATALNKPQKPEKIK